jgi:hypothetical protein
MYSPVLDDGESDEQIDEHETRDKRNAMNESSNIVFVHSPFFTASSLPITIASLYLVTRHQAL